MSYTSAANCLTIVYDKTTAHDTDARRWSIKIVRGSTLTYNARVVSAAVRGQAKGIHTPVLDTSSAQRDKLVTSTAQTGLNSALAGDRKALSELIATLTPVIQARVARQLLHLPNHKDRRQEIKDVTQDIFLYLFQHSGRALQAWDPERGMSLQNYVGLIAERQTVSHLRSGKRNPWREAHELDNIEEPSDARSNIEQQAIASDNLNALLAELKQSLSPLGWRVFDLLYIKELSVDEVTKSLNMNADAVYAWRSRLRKQAKKCQQALMTSSQSTSPLSSTGAKPRGWSND